MKKIYLYILSGALLLSLLYGCKKEPVEEPVVIPPEIIATNNWIYENMSQFYFWNDQMTTGIDTTKESDPEAYFYKLVYKEEDF